MGTALLSAPIAPKRWARGILVHHSQDSMVASASFSKQSTFGGGPGSELR